MLACLSIRQIVENGPMQTRLSLESKTATAAVLERMLAEPQDAKPDGGLAEAVVARWAETSGALTDGGRVRLGASCLVQPAPGDRVLIWSGNNGQRWILHVLEQVDDQPVRITMSRPVTVAAPRIALSADSIHIQAEDFLTSTRNRHAVEHVRTETVNTRVAQIGTDIRRASHVSDEVQGTVLQRAGTWISNTFREARFHARAFLFD